MSTAAPPPDAGAPDWDALLESPASQALLERLLREALAELQPAREDQAAPPAP